MAGIYTAQYRYSGPDRLDITVKGQDPVGKVLAPTWEMVRGYKENPLKFQPTYTEMYYAMLNRHAIMPDTQKLLFGIIETAKLMDITFVCFCRSGAFCHRVLAARWLEENYNIEYRGER